MSIRLSTRYTVVPRAAASLSMGVSGWTKCDTSAISILRISIQIWVADKTDLRTPASTFPLGRRRAWSASSISWQPKP